MSKLVIKNISAGYGAVQVLHDVTLHVNPGETVVLLGTNGNAVSYTHLTLPTILLV